jgi:hypothetical protein
LAAGRAVFAGGFPTEAPAPEPLPLACAFMPDAPPAAERVPTSARPWNRMAPAAGAFHRGRTCRVRSPCRVSASGSARGRAPGTAGPAIGSKP